VARRLSYRLPPTDEVVSSGKGQSCAKLQSFLELLFFYRLSACRLPLPHQVLSVGWVDWTSDQVTCVKRGSDKMRISGFTASFKVVNNRTIIGAQGEYSAAIRCAASKKIAFVAVAGPSPQDALKFLNPIKEGF
jgi:hypothetical protein